MKFARPVVALVLGVSLIATGVAEAKTKPKRVCNFIVDPTGDAAPTAKDLIFPLDLDPVPVPPINAPSGFPNAAIGSSNDALDVTSADIASDKKNVTVVIRVKKLAPTAPTSAPSGMRWKFFFTAEEIIFSMGAHTDPTGALSYDAAYTDPRLGGQLYGGGVTGTFDQAKNEIHLTAPTSLFAAQATIKLGTKLSALNVLTGTELAVPDKGGKFGGGALLRSYPTTSDSASSPKTYAGGGLSCVTPGK